MSATPLEASIAALEAQRGVLGDAVVDAAVGALRAQLAAIPPVHRDADGERRVVTVMFADLSGFTALGEKHDAEHLRETMNACFARLTPVIQRYGGTIDKFVGDEIMALFGAPIAHEDDADRSLHAALDMQEALVALNREMGTSLGLHFGINTGPVAAGGIGDGQRRDYSVMGDTVNVAARLEAASQNGEILVGPETHRLTCRRFISQNRGRCPCRARAPLSSSTGSSTSGAVTTRRPSSRKPAVRSSAVPPRSPC